MISRDVGGEHFPQQRNFLLPVAPTVGGIVNVAGQERRALPGAQFQITILTTPNGTLRDFLPRLRA
jgi:hypothetical protein